jgi:hypothetical protein
MNDGSRVAARFSKKVDEKNLEAASSNRIAGGLEAWEGGIKG